MDRITLIKEKLKRILKNYIQQQQILSRWAPLLQSINVPTQNQSWMSNYAQQHQMSNSSQTISVAPFPTQNSGNSFPSILPMAMKVAAQTIGLDLVSVVPMSAPKMNLMWLDFKYGDKETRAEMAKRIRKEREKKLNRIFYSRSNRVFNNKQKLKRILK